MEMRVNIIAGPTACGKSGIALARAKGGGVVINADSQQVFEHLPTLTASPSAADKREVPHRLYNFLSPTEQMNAGRWAELAVAEVRAALEKGLEPFVVGGTGLYIKALMEGLSEFPEIPAEVREKVRAMKPEELPRGLDRQRAMRATEVLMATGKPIEWWKDQPKKKLLPDVKFSLEIIKLPVAELNERIEKRAREIIDTAIEEVRELEWRDLPEDAPIYKVIGAADISRHLSGEIRRSELIEALVIATRRYAKRQRTFFRTQF